MLSLAQIQLQPNKKVYFASDFHLGLPNKATSLKREQLIINWLDAIAPTAQHIFLMGDLFDAWIEYKHAVPKGFVRFLGKLAQLKDSGIGITVFTGNHDLWMYGYFEEELNIPVMKQEVAIKINNFQYVIAHGDGLGPGDKGYKFLKSFLNNPICQWLYRWLHPDIGIPLAQFFSFKGINKKEKPKEIFNPEKEYLVQFAKSHLQHSHANYFIFGHRHYMLTYDLGNNSKYINLGDWLQYNSYAVADETGCVLMQYDK